LVDARIAVRVRIAVIDEVNCILVVAAKVEKVSVQEVKLYAEMVMVVEKVVVEKVMVEKVMVVVMAQVTVVEEMVGGEPHHETGVG
jgi:hypothetical protein